MTQHETEKQGANASSLDFVTNKLGLFECWNQRGRPAPNLTEIESMSIRIAETGDAPQNLSCFLPDGNSSQDAKCVRK